MKRTLIMRGSLYFPMLDGETVEQAVDRLFDALDTVGTAVTSWWEKPEIYEHEDDE